MRAKLVTANGPRRHWRPILGCNSRRQLRELAAEPGYDLRCAHAGIQPSRRPALKTSPTGRPLVQSASRPAASRPAAPQGNSTRRGSPAVRRGWRRWRSRSRPGRRNRRYAPTVSGGNGSGPLEPTMAAPQSAPFTTMGTPTIEPMPTQVCARLPHRWCLRGRQSGLGVRCATPAPQRRRPPTECAPRWGHLRYPRLVTNGNHEP